MGIFIHWVPGFKNRFGKMMVPFIEKDHFFAERVLFFPAPEEQKGLKVKPHRNIFAFQRIITGQSEIVKCLLLEIQFSFAPVFVKKIGVIIGKDHLKRKRVFFYIRYKLVLLVKKFHIVKEKRGKRRMILNDRGAFLIQIFQKLGKKRSGPQSSSVKKR
jgi:hypothetical protein